MPRLEVAGDICLRRSRPTEGFTDDENRASSFTWERVTGARER
jgi:hypothetical protein